MLSLQELFNSAKNAWLQLGMATKLGVIVTTIVMLTAMAGVAVWSSRPQFTTLANNLSPAEAAEIVSKLDSEKIEHQLNFSASAVLVPKNQWNRARLLIGERAEDSAASPEWNDMLLGDPTVNHYKMARYQERSLAISIQRVRGVSQATVHIARPERSPFVRDQRPVTASVVLQFQSGFAPAQETTNAITSLVAGSVEGLAPENVALMDTEGRILSDTNGGVGGEVGAQFEYRRLLESDLAAKADFMLTRMLGFRRAIVRVSADVDFTQSERQKTFYDPESKVPKKEEIVSKSITGGPRQALPAGVQSLGLRSGQTSVATTAPGINEKTEESTTDYEIGTSVDVIKEAPGKIRRLTIAVIADVSEPTTSEDADDADTEAADVGAPRRPSKEQIEQIVKQATGFNEERGDQIEVLLTSLVGLETEDQQFVQTNRWQTYERLLRHGSLGLASLVALVVGLMTVRRLKPIRVPTEPAPDPLSKSSDLADRVRDNPDIVKALVSAWLDDENPSSDDSERRAA